MEDTLGGRVAVFNDREDFLVLILVLMEDTLGDKEKPLREQLRGS